MTLTRSVRAWFASRTGRLVLHDGAIAVGVAVAYLETTAQPIDRGVLIAAGVVAVKAFLRLILPVPPAPKVAPEPDAGYALVELLVAAVLLVLFVWLVVSLVGR